MNAQCTIDTPAFVETLCSVTDTGRGNLGILWRVVTDGTSGDIFPMQSLMYCACGQSLQPAGSLWCVFPRIVPCVAATLNWTSHDSVVATPSLRAYEDRH